MSIEEELEKFSEEIGEYFLNALKEKGILSEKIDYETLRVTQDEEDEHLFHFHFEYREDNDEKKVEDDT